MTKEELQAIGLTDEQITEVFKLKGKAVNELKDKISVLETEKADLQNQINVANGEIESYKSMDFEGIKKSAEEYKGKFEQLQQESENNLKALKFEHTVDMMLANSKAKNSKAVKALLDLENLSKSNNIDTDLATAIANLQESDSYLFSTDDGKTKEIKGATPAESGEGSSQGQKVNLRDLSYEDFLKTLEN